MQKGHITGGRAEGQFSQNTRLLDSASLAYLAALMDKMSLSDEFLYVYIMANSIGVLYIGVTNHLVRRIHQHQTKTNSGFTNTKHCKKLLYFEIHDSPGEAIEREKQIKNWNRMKKERLIRSLNPPWIDLSSFLPSYEGDGG